MKDKGAVALILADREKRRGGAEGAEDEEEPGGLEAAAGDVLAAMKAGDASGFAEAMKAFVQMCSYDEG